MTNLRSVARPTGKVAIAGQGHVGLPKISDERCAVIEDGSGPWRSPPGRAAGGLLHRRRTTPDPQSGSARHFLEAGGPEGEQRHRQHAEGQAAFGRRPVASVASSINHPGNVALRTPDATLSEGRSPSVNRTCPARGKPPNMPFRWIYVIRSRLNQDGRADHQINWPRGPITRNLFCNRAHSGGQHQWVGE